LIALLRNYQLDQNSFWLGFIAGLIFIYILSKLRIYIPGIIKLAQQAFSSAHESLSTGVEQRYRLDVVQFAQRQHLASTMFSLDEVALEPFLMVPPMQVSFDNQSLPIDTINFTIPYIPDWPELGAIYQTPKISVFDTLQGGANLLLAGNPGSGKSIALALIASKIARRDPRLGGLVNLLPILVHAVELKYSPDLLDSTDGVGDIPVAGKQIDTGKVNSPVDDIIISISRQASKLTLSHLPSLIHKAFTDHRVIILLDGMDELPPDQINKTTIFIKNLLEQYPKTRIVASVSFNNLSQLPAIGFQTYAMSAWGDTERSAFTQKWGRIWEKLQLQSGSRDSLRINQYFLDSWLSAHSLPCTPLETTLKVWAAYSGDILGADNPCAIEAYIRRMTMGRKKTRSGLESFALQMVTRLQPVLLPQQIEYLSVPEEPSIPLEITPDAENVPTEIPDSLIDTGMPVTIELVDTGLLQSHSESRLSFISPVIAGYLAGTALVKFGGISEIQRQPTWTGKSTALFYMAYGGDVTPAIQFLSKQDDFLCREQLGIARYLQIAPKNRPWRTLILRKLAALIQTEYRRLSFSAKVITAIALSGDPGVFTLLRQMLHSENVNLRLLSALACGMVGEPKLVDDLTPLLHETSPALVRACCLALVAIGDKRSLEIIIDALHHGTEEMRRSAAEALANHPIEGHPVLEEGSSNGDLMVRRAIIYGLMRIRQPWAIKILERMQLEDGEWIVRNAAIQAIEEIYNPDIYIPKPLPDLTETAWLVDYAARQGVGVAPGKPAYNLLLQALSNGTEIERLQALDYLKLFGEEGSIPLIYKEFLEGTGETRDAAYNTLWSLANSGVAMPSPIQSSN